MIKKSLQALIATAFTVLTYTASAQIFVSSTSLVASSNITEVFFSGELVSCGYSLNSDTNDTRGSYATIMNFKDSNDASSAAYAHIVFTKKDESIGISLCNLMDKKVFVDFDLVTKKVAQLGASSHRFPPNDLRIRPQTK